MRRIFLPGLFVVGISAYAFAQDAVLSPVFKGMKIEMDRSVQRLKFEDFTPPYFLSYALTDSRDSSLSARYGSLLQEQNYRNRYLYVELRYGSYKMDNSDEGSRGSSDTAPLDDDEDSLRHRLWLMTDQVQAGGKRLSAETGQKFRSGQRQATDFSEAVSTAPF